MLEPELAGGGVGPKAAHVQSLAAEYKSGDPYPHLVVGPLAANPARYGCRHRPRALSIDKLAPLVHTRARGRTAFSLARLFSLSFL